MAYAIVCTIFLAFDEYCRFLVMLPRKPAPPTGGTVGGIGGVSTLRGLHAEVQVGVPFFVVLNRDLHA